MTQHKLAMAVAKGGGGPESNMICVFVIVGIHQLVRLEITTAVTSFNLFFYTTSKRNLVGTRLLYVAVVLTMLEKCL